MMNTNILREKYIKFVPEDVDTFIKEVDSVKRIISSKVMKPKVPTLIYSKNKRNAIYYLTAVHNCLLSNRILDYVVITGQTFQREHFADKDKDSQLIDSVYHTDLLFLSLSQIDYTSEYLENLLIDLIEFRQQREKITVVSYDIVDSTNYMHVTKKLRAHFETNNYNLISMLEGNPFNKQKEHSTNSTVKEQPQKVKAGRIK